MESEARKAHGCRLTIIEGVPILVIGTGNHDCERIELTPESCDGVAIDWLNHRLGKKLDRS